MSGQKYSEFLASLAVTTPTEAEKFTRLDETGASQVSAWQQMYEALDERYPSASSFVTHDGTILYMAQVTQAEYDALVTPEPTTLYIIIG